MTQTVKQVGEVQVRPVLSPGDQELFLDVPSVVYAGDRHWVPPLRSSIAKYFKPENTFFEYGRLQQFIATRFGPNGTQPVGRVVAAVNDRLIAREGENIGLVGFFECIDEAEVGKALLDSACDWLRQQGMSQARGPIDLSTHNNCLFLVDGFDSMPYMMMPYNPRHYPRLFEQHGWQKAKDAYAYLLDLTKPLPPEFERAHRIASKSGITFRNLRLKGDEFIEDCTAIYHLFNKAFADNWSSTPRTLEEFLEEAKSLQDIADPDVFIIAEYEGEMVGFFMALPNYSPVLQKVNGKLDWLGILKFLWYRRSIDTGRVVAICSLPEYIRKLVPMALIYLGREGGVTKRKPYREAELSWVYEDNMPSRKIIEATGAKIYKTYRIYQKSL
ncbi:hypothetical protein HPC62_06395 [Thermoleptolyngbya sichuanensis A183]|uniref:N-acetyltransferase domain-containing protein n=1 Tax=Thermoleptolyngbya sichuanensis A183 TaxID=2737172 RepID=A0A6M8BAQ0_9CYAN|nr:MULTISPECIES: hypothetical protein [Thermoleptolyngbya]QKD81877.1 hypothetical protein HPC62_06395 [Thermoleptolyngbya sichuanensis A183]